MIHADRLISRQATIADIDSVKTRRKELGTLKDVRLIETINTLWDNMADFREKRARANRFAYGDQWGDSIVVNGKVMTQREYLMKQGNVVLQTNQIKNKIDTVVGVLVKEKNEPLANARDRDEQQYAEVMTEGLKANCQANKMESLYIKWMKELCIGGLAASYESYDAYTGPSGRLDAWTTFVEPNCIFLDAGMNDPRFWDLRIIGQFFDLSFEDLAARFAKSTRDYAILRDIYPDQSVIFREKSTGEISDKVEDNSLSFLEPAEADKCRVFEVWTKESKARIRLHDWNDGSEEIIDADDHAYRQQIRQENESRKRLAIQAGIPEDQVPYITGDGYGADSTEKDGFFVDEYWYFRFLAPEGTILMEGESPYPGRLHPFSICATPFVDGKIVGYMSDAIDHNIAINRAIILHDWLIRSQAKGVTVVPKAIVPDDMSLDEFAESWTSIDDMVFINMKQGQEGLMPKVFYGSAQTFNVSELINTYSHLMENSTAVSSAIQGKTPYSGTSGSLYAQMTANASTPIAALLSQFHMFLEDMHLKKMKNIAMFYDEDRWRQIAGKIDGIFDNENLNLAEVEDIEFDLSVKESTETPVYRAMINDDAKEFLMNGLISMEEYLTIAQVPYADKLLQMRQARQAEMEAAQGGQMGLGAQEMAQAGGQAQAPAGEPQQQPFGLPLYANLPKMPGQ